MWQPEPVGLLVQDVASTGSMFVSKNVVEAGWIVVHESGGSETASASRPTASAAGPVPFDSFAMVFGGLT